MTSKVKNDLYAYLDGSKRSQHVVSGEIAASILTQRSEILSSLRIRIERGHVPTKEELLGIIGLLETSIDDWRKVTKLQQYLEKIAKVIQDTSKHLDGRADQLRELSSDLDKIDKVMSE